MSWLCGVDALPSLTFPLVHLLGFSSALFKDAGSEHLRLWALCAAAVGILLSWETQACTLHTFTMHLPSMKPKLSGGKEKPLEAAKWSFLP